MEKNNIIVVFGGQSSEHDVSRASAKTIISSINKEKFNIYPVGITKEGKWLLYKGDYEGITSETWHKDCVEAIISPDATEKALIIIENNKVNKVRIDVAFPVLHGLYGEDGSIQGLFELANINYVGCKILASAISMDKLYTKIVVETLGIKQAKYVKFYKEDNRNEVEMAEETERNMEYPVFVKPSNAGSSVGITKAHNREELVGGIKLAFENDRKILIEENINGREIECAILGNYNAKASGLGEILPAAEFYDYDAKYNNLESKTIISPDVPKDIEDRIREYAVKIFKAVDGTGLSRVDFFLDKKTNEIIFNEINTLPGFTNISMYPMLWEEKGISKEQLIDKLIMLSMQIRQ